MKKRRHTTWVGMAFGFPCFKHRKQNPKFSDESNLCATLWKEAMTFDDVMSFVADHVSSYKHIRIVEFIDAIPRSAFGKILRRELREA